ncbi:spore germination protein [Ammoniphilus resinae]|uniref:Spore germination protein n=1 Tax=Ammoniphilus resinae TaxID=861532 RepID=A0ABS4GLE0_9BACL|nr:spore germination protein [Ammoniphilus resinae]MBP1931078.1 hypothetical protein [Ammoniphilus resinae]
MFFFRKKRGVSQNKQSSESSPDLKYIPSSKKEMEMVIKSVLQDDTDLVIKSLQHPGKELTLFYFSTLTDRKIIQKSILSVLQNLQAPSPSLEEIEASLPIGEVQVTESLDQVIQTLHNGWTLLHIEGKTNALLINTFGMKERGLTTPENESHVFGPQVSFNESLATNTGLIRKYIASPKLHNENLEVGKITRTKVSMLYIEGVASEQNVNTLRQRITELELDQLIDSSMLVQLIEDNSMSVFPQMMLTERPDRVSAFLLEGKLAVLVDGSPYAIVCPSTFIEFFQTSEDYYVRWNMATFVRMLRMIAMFLSIFFTPVYVASLTFHYEVIPSALLVPLAQSRAKVPFPPLFEALLLELIIEFLREAGARLPTKVGQTMGIVGGIVIGQAAVQAGFTSNILIIIVALGALSSFTTPSYMMGTTIRIIRFPMILLAGIWGGFGIMFGFCFLLIHLLRQSSLGSPYLEPFYPIRLRDLQNSVVRMPFPFFSKRMVLTRAEDKGKFNAKRAKQKKDIDE